MNENNSLKKLKEFNKKLEQIQLDSSSIKEQFFTKDESNINIIINNSGELVDVGDTFAKLIGYSKKELIGKNFIDLVYKKDKVQTAEVFSKRDYILDKNFVFRNRYLCKDGSLLKLEWHKAIRNGNCT
jgi:PAS domain S-box-containing protein